MGPSIRQVDHIVYAVPNLEIAMRDFEERTGIKPVFGGQHLNQGTKNALVNIGNQAYLEFIAVDSENKNIKPPRWMGVDFIKTPQITRWSIKTTAIEQDALVLKHYNPALSKIHKGQRKTEQGQLLSWQMTLPLASPKVELIPFSLNWTDSEFHPCDQLPEQGELVGLILHHPAPTKIMDVLNSLDVSQKVYQGEHPKIEIKLHSPKGVITI